MGEMVKLNQNCQHHMISTDHLFLHLDFTVIQINSQPVKPIHPKGWNYHPYLYGC